MLVTVDLTVSLYAPEQRDWSHYSLDVEAEEKRLHERILEEQLGKPSTGANLPSDRSPAKQDTLNQRVDWRFTWGQASSCHDTKGGGTFVRVSYGNRREEAAAAYRARHTGRT